MILIKEIGVTILLNKNSLDIKSASKLLPKREPFSHKGSFGRALLICGSKNMVGCCALATEGALRSGAGLVTLAFPDCLYIPLTSRLTENTFLPLPSKDGKLSTECLPALIKELNKYDVVMFGCGVGKNDDIQKILQGIIKNCEKPLIIDADGLNALSENMDILKCAKTDILLTPHPGEMSRLVKKDIDYINENREKVVTDFVKEYNVNVLLKGHNTQICKNDAITMCINKTGNTGLSKGGSGDLLSGMIAGFTPALKGDLYKAACLGAYIHGYSAELVSEELTEFSTLPTDCAKKIGKVIKIVSESE